MGFGMKEIALLSGALLAPHIAEGKKTGKRPDTVVQRIHYSEGACDNLRAEARRSVSEMLVTAGISIGTGGATTSALAERFGDEVFDACMNDPDFKASRHNWGDTAMSQ